MSISAHESHSIVASDKFILATRDAGYRSVAAAIAELIDNSLQADARCIDVVVRDVVGGSGRSIAVGVVDDGHGMDAPALQAALQFGGSSRFGERVGLGRFGMGLPNSSVSQTRRVDVYSWQNGGPVLSTYLDVDEVASGELRSIPAPTKRDLPTWVGTRPPSAGTVVEWNRCDRLTRQRSATVAQRLRDALGRVYRSAIWNGARISVNSEVVNAIDPLFLHPKESMGAATAYGSPMIYDFSVRGRGSARVEVRFSELPVSAWHELTTPEKRRRGIVGRAGVSIMRADREIDYGWFLMGAKRRENYDDWWRCEIRFSPQLDELFGVTNSKQGIRPSHDLRAALEPDLEAIARTLNRRVREAFEKVKMCEPTRASRRASDADQHLPVPRPLTGKVVGGGFRYRIQVGTLSTPDFYRANLLHDTVLVTLNREHPFVARAYLPVCESDSPERYHLECLILAAARADLEAVGSDQRELLSRVRRSWSDALVAFVEG